MLKQHFQKILRIRNYSSSNVYLQCRVGVLQNTTEETLVFYSTSWLRAFLLPTRALRLFSIQINLRQILLPLMVRTPQPFRLLHNGWLLTLVKHKRITTTPLASSLLLVTLEAAEPQQTRTLCLAKLLPSLRVVLTLLQLTRQVPFIFLTKMIPIWLL